MSTHTLQSFTGPWGTITELPKVAARPDMPEQDATLSHWFLHAPPAHPLWPNYLFFCVHLRDVEGQTRPPTRPHPDDSHNIMLIALNPELGPWTAENVMEKMLAPRTESVWLSPLNISEFVRRATDAEAIKLTGLLARALVHGIVPIEPDDFRGGRDRWRGTISQTMEHIRHGGHPSRDN